jgi:hypothetical protein
VVRNQPTCQLLPTRFKPKTRAATIIFLALALLRTATYTDEVEVSVSVSINLDEKGERSEINISKVDFSPLLRFPTPALVVHDPDLTSNRVVAGWSPTLAAM